MGKDLTIVHEDYIAIHTKTDKKVIEFEDGDYICEVNKEYRPLIYCRDCKHARKSLNKECIYCERLAWSMFPDGFCCFGKRKRGEYHE